MKDKLQILKKKKKDFQFKLFLKIKIKCENIIKMLSERHTANFKKEKKTDL